MIVDDVGIDDSLDAVADSLLMASRLLLALNAFTTAGQQPTASASL
jgi:hypothetical protein